LIDYAINGEIPPENYSYNSPLSPFLDGLLYQGAEDVEVSAYDFSLKLRLQLDLLAPVSKQPKNLPRASIKTE
jgi:hypothetical protein